MKPNNTIIVLLTLNFLKISHSTDFDNARIIGIPQTSCSSRSIIITFDTNIPFQGRISVFNKLFTPACNRDYSDNIQRNASFQIDISKCTDAVFLKNGSRILKAQVEIGFHPLVITNNDRMFLIECYDHTELPIINLSSKFANCTHHVRIATEWKAMTEFNVGDPIVHEWSCSIPHTERTQTYLTSCSALSQSGQVIRLIDENGCVIDSELMGDVVYNDHVPKFYARARIFKFLTEEKYRIECSLEFCNGESLCKHRVFPPKCAYTKDEIKSRSFSNSSEEQSITINPGSHNNLYDTRVRISSSWLTITLNRHTETAALKDRYHLKTYLNKSLLDPTSSTTTHHFLMGISFREPNAKAKQRGEPSGDFSRIEAATILHPSVFQPVLNPPLDSREEFIETITFGANTGINMNSQELSPDSTKKFSRNSWRSQQRGAGELQVHKNITDLTHFKVLETMLTTSTSRNDVLTSALTRKFTPTTPYPSMVSTEKQINDISSSSSLKNKPTATARNYGRFVSNNADWRFDEKAINDSDIVAEKQIGSCVNATIISTSRQFQCSGFEHLLFIWSFASLLVWIILAAIFLYKYTSNRPKWMGIREQEIRKVMESRVLSHEHPWLHADAFEEKCSNKNAIAINT